MNHHFKGMWGSFGAGDDPFDRPSGICVDSDGNVYVTDTGNHRIQIFSSDGGFIRKWGRYEYVDGRHLGSAKDIAVDSNDDNYVTYALHHIVKKFDEGGHFIRQRGSHGIGDAEFDHPNGIATFSGNSLLVLDSDNHRIQEFLGMVFSLQNGDRTERNQVSLSLHVA
jgi:DNA-binding beta-propeller fold protein YncE